MLSLARLLEGGLCFGLAADPAHVCSCPGPGRVAVVRNRVIENGRSLREELQAEGVRTTSLAGWRSTAVSSRLRDARPGATEATSATPALLGAALGATGFQCSLYRTRKEALKGLGRPLPRDMPAGTVQWASGCL